MLVASETREVKPASSELFTLWPAKKKTTLKRRKNKLLRFAFKGLHVLAKRKKKQQQKHWCFPLIGVRFKGT